MDARSVSPANRSAASVNSMSFAPARKNRFYKLAALLVIGGLAFHDAAVPAQRAVGANAALFAIDEYRAHISPHLRGVVFCRFQPTCSAYARESIRKHGLLISGTKSV